MKYILLAITYFILLSVVGCDLSSIFSNNPNYTYDKIKGIWWKSTPEFIDMKLHVPDSASLSERVPISLSIKNIGEEPIVLTSNSGCGIRVRGEIPCHDFFVTTLDSVVVWHYNPGVRLLDMGFFDTLYTNDIYSFNIKWNQRDINNKRIPEGEYFIWGVYEGGFMKEEEEHYGGPYGAEPQKIIIYR